MKRLIVTAAAGLALWTVLAVPGHGQTPASKLIVGKWQPLDMNVSGILEFLKDGKVQITAKDVVIPGTYKFTDETTMEVTMTFAGKDAVIKLKVNVTEDSLTTQEIGKERTEQFKRIK